MTNERHPMTLMAVCLVDAHEQGRHAERGRWVDICPACQAERAATDVDFSWIAPIVNDIARRNPQQEVNP